MIATPQLAPTSSWKNVRTEFATSISGWKMVGRDGQHHAGTPGFGLKQRAGLDRVVAAVAERVAAREPPGGQDRAARRRPARASPARRRRSRWARTCSGAGGPARPSAGRARIGARTMASSARFTFYAPSLGAFRPRARPPRPAPRARSRRRRAPSRSSSPATSGRATRTKSCAARERVAQRPECLSQRALHRISLYGAADLAAHGDPEPHLDVVGVAVAARKRVEDQEPVRVRAALAVDALEVAAARQAASPAALARGVTASAACDPCGAGA